MSQPPTAPHLHQQLRQSFCTSSMHPLNQPEGAAWLPLGPPTCTSSTGSAQPLNLNSPRRCTSADSRTSRRGGRWKGDGCCRREAVSAGDTSGWSPPAGACWGPAAGAAKPARLANSGLATPTEPAGSPGGCHCMCGSDWGAAEMQGAREWPACQDVLRVGGPLQYTVRCCSTGHSYQLSGQHAGGQLRLLRGWQW